MPPKYKAAYEGDVVELREDLPKYNLKRGQRGIVITEFDTPSEAYDLEMQDKEGNLLGFAYSVKPHQFNNLSLTPYIRGIELLEKHDDVAAEKEFKKAIDFRPDYIGVLLNSILDSCQNNLTPAIPLLRMVLRIDPSFELARANLAITLLNIGISKARAGEQNKAFEYFSRSLAIETEPDVQFLIKKNFSALFTEVGNDAYQKKNFEASLTFIRRAYMIMPSAENRRNLGFAYANLALSQMKNGKLSEAIELFEIVEDLGFVLPAFLNDYGVCLASMGRIKEARQAFERALELEPLNELIESNLLKLDRAEGGEPKDLSLEDVSTEFDLGPLESVVLRRPNVSSREPAPI